MGYTVIPDGLSYKMALNIGSFSKLELCDIITTVYKEAQIYQINIRNLEHEISNNDLILWWHIDNNSAENEAFLQALYELGYNDMGTQKSTDMFILKSEQGLSEYHEHIVPEMFRHGIKPENVTIEPLRSGYLVIVS